MNDRLDERADDARAELAGAIRRQAGSWSGAADVRRVALRRQRINRGVIPVLVLVAAGGLALRATDDNNGAKATVVADRPADRTDPTIPTVATDGNTPTTASQAAGPTTPKVTSTTAPRPSSPAAACAAGAPVASPSGLWAIPARGPAVNLYETHNGDRLAAPVRSPDGARFAFFLTNENRDGADLVVADRLGSTRLSHELLAGTIAWSPDGRDLVLSPGDTTNQGGTAPRLEVIPLSGGQRRTIWEQPAPKRIGSVTGHPDGTQMLFVVSGAYTGRLDDAILAEVRLDGTGYREIATNLSRETRLALSPDSRSVAVVAGGSRVVIDLTTGVERIVAPSPAGAERTPSPPGAGYRIDDVIGWSPDGTWLAFLHGGGSMGGTVSLQLVTGGRTIAYSHPGNSGAFAGESYGGIAFSADGRHAVAVQSPGSMGGPPVAQAPFPASVQVIDLLDGSSRTVLPNGYRLIPSGADGILTAWTDFEKDAGDTTLCRMSIDGSDATPVLRIKDGNGIVSRMWKTDALTWASDGTVSVAVAIP